MDIFQTHRNVERQQAPREFIDMFTHFFKTKSPPSLKPALIKRFFVGCRTGNIEAVEKCLHEGVPPDLRDENHLTGLIWTGRKGQTAVAELLLKGGAELEASDARGRTALFHAAVFDRREYVQRLAQLGANLNPVDRHGATPTDGAFGQQHDAMVDLLKSLGGRHEYHTQ